MLRYNDIKSHENVSDNIRLSSFQADTQGYKLEPISLLKHVPLFAPSLPFFISLFLPVRFPSVEIQTNRKETKKRAKMDNVLEGPSVTSSGRVKKKRKKKQSKREWAVSGLVMDWMGQSRERLLHQKQLDQTERDSNQI